MIRKHPLISKIIVFIEMHSTSLQMSGCTYIIVSSLRLDRNGINPFSLFLILSHVRMLNRHMKIISFLHIGKITPENQDKIFMDHTTLVVSDFRLRESINFFYICNTESVRFLHYYYRELLSYTRHKLQLSLQFSISYNLHRMQNVLSRVKQCNNQNLILLRDL